MLSEIVGHVEIFISISTDSMIHVCLLSSSKGTVHAIKRCLACATTAPDGARHARYVHRDTNAACNIANVYMGLATGRKRPVCFDRASRAS